MIDFISQSSLNQFLRCQAQWERRWINGEIIPPAIAARRGSGVHKAAAVNHTQKIISKVDAPLDVLQDAARDHYVHLIKDEGVFIPKDQLGEKDKLLVAGLDATVNLTGLYHRDLAPLIQPVMAEERLMVDVGLGVPLAGTLDVVTDEDWLPDLKTTERSKRQEDADTSIQLTFYAGLYADHAGHWPSKISLEILVNTKEPKLQSLTTTRGPQDWVKLMNRIQFMVAQIGTGLFPPCDPSSWWCSERWCGYYSTCKYV